MTIGQSDNTMFFSSRIHRLHAHPLRRLRYAATFGCQGPKGANSGSVPAWGPLMPTEAPLRVFFVKTGNVNPILADVHHVHLLAFNSPLTRLTSSDWQGSGSARVVTHTLSTGPGRHSVKCPS